MDQKRNNVNYKYILRNLQRYSDRYGLELRVCDASLLTKKEFISEKKYWKNFYMRFTKFLYDEGCYDNYVGTNIKMVRVFFNYLKNDVNFPTGDFHKLFYVRREEVEVLVLSPEELNYLVHDVELERRLTLTQKRVKDIFVFGCVTGLRYSDIF